MKKEKIVALFAEPSYLTDNELHVWQGFTFNTSVQRYVENFMQQVFGGRYYLVYESDFRKSKKKPYHFQYRNDASAWRWINVMTTDVKVTRQPDGGCIFEIKY